MQITAMEDVILFKTLSYVVKATSMQAIGAIQIIFIWYSNICNRLLQANALA